MLVVICGGVRGDSGFVVVVVVVEGGGLINVVVAVGVVFHGARVTRNAAVLYDNVMWFPPLGP